MTRNKISYSIVQVTNDTSFNGLLFFSFHSVYPTTIQQIILQLQKRSSPYYEVFLTSVIYIVPVTKLKAELFVLSFDGGCKRDLWISMVLLGRIFRHASWLSPKGDVSKAAAIDLPSFGGIHEEYELKRFLFFFLWIHG